MAFKGAVVRSENPFLRKLEGDLIKQYEVLRENEAMLWKQKSRENGFKREIGTPNFST